MSHQYTKKDKIEQYDEKLARSKRSKRSHQLDLENKRTILGLYDSRFKEQDLPKYILGLIIYVIIFVVLVPYFMLRNNVSDEIFMAYIPNVDILATVLGYEGGPFSDIWRYLYNPSNMTLFGFFSTSIMNYFALLGATFMVAWQTHKHKSWKRGWSAAFIFLIVTYLLPGNIIVILQNRFGNYLNTYFDISDDNKLLQYIIGVAFGLIIAISIILAESMIIKSTRHYIEYGIHVVHNAVKYHFKN